MMEKLTLTDEMRDEMFEYAIDVINKDSFSQSDWSMLQEEDRFYNWYYGYTKIKAPSYMYEQWDYLVHTAATSGVVSTQYYGEQFTSRLVTPLLNGPITKNRVQRSGILHIVRDP